VSEEVSLRIAGLRIEVESGRRLFRAQVYQLKSIMTISAFGK